MEQETSPTDRDRLRAYEPCSAPPTAGPATSLQSSGARSRYRPQQPRWAFVALARRAGGRASICCSACRWVPAGILGEERFDDLQSNPEVIRDIPSLDYNSSLVRSPFDLPQFCQVVPTS